MIYSLWDFVIFHGGYYGVTTINKLLLALCFKEKLFRSKNTLGAILSFILALAVQQ